MSSVSATDDSVLGAGQALAADLGVRSALDRITEATSNIDDDNQVPAVSLDGAVATEPTQVTPANELQVLRKEVENLRNGELKGGALEVDFLIATLPDPIDSHSINEFDNALSAVQYALNENGFLLDRFSLQWSAWLAHKGDAALPRDYHRHPGAMLFRHDAIPDSMGTAAEKRRSIARNRLLVVLLVGETPTSGVHKAALDECLDIVAAWHIAGGNSKKKHLHVPVLGPSFSGSAKKLFQNLNESGNVRPSRNARRHTHGGACVR